MTPQAPEHKRQLGVRGTSGPQERALPWPGSWLEGKGGAELEPLLAQLAPEC